MILQDKMNQAYLRNIFNDTIVISGQMWMPFKTMLDNEVNKIVNFAGMVVFPIAMALCLPLFITNLVSEKESKLTVLMKINGLKMRNYWIVNGIYNFCFYWVTVLVNIYVGRSIGLVFFTDTNILLLFEAYACWGLC